jgi:hypothetical protein
MALLSPTRDLLIYLRTHPDLRARIRSRPNATLLYAGAFFRPIWREILLNKQSDPQLASKQILPEVLATLTGPGMPHPNLLAWVQALDTLQSWAENGFIAWRALSGIFAANAVGAVSFSIGAPISRVNKVFAATEIGVLARNPNVDGTTRDLLAYFQRCLQSKQAADINFGFVAG